MYFLTRFWYFEIFTLVREGCHGDLLQIPIHKVSYIFCPSWLPFQRSECWSGEVVLLHLNFTCFNLHSSWGRKFLKPSPLLRILTLIIFSKVFFFVQWSLQSSFDISKTYILTFVRPCKFVDCKNRIHRCRKKNTRQWKYLVNCVGGMPEGRVTTGAWASKKCNREVFNNETQSSELWAESTETRHHAVWGGWPGEGPDSPGLRSWEKSKCTRLANIESEYDPRTMKKRSWLNVLSLPGDDAWISRCWFSTNYPQRSLTLLEAPQTVASKRKTVMTSSLLLYLRSNLHDPRWEGKPDAFNCYLLGINPYSEDQPDVV